VPRKIAGDNDKPRRRRGADAVAAEADEARGLVMRILLHSPKDMVAGALAFAAVSAIIANALFLQAGRHPSPMFGSVVAMPASPLPRPRPVEADASLAEPRLAEPRLSEPRLSEPRLSEPRLPDSRLAEPKLSEPRPAEPKPAEKPAEQKPADPLTSLVKATSAPPAAASSNVLRPPAAIPSRTDSVANSAQGARRVAAVQRALTEYGYGQLKPTGTVGSDTQAAIQKFERERKIPVTGQISDRLVRELTAVIGHPLD
jgi:Putative peptidoglycan binding domain